MRCDVKDIQSYKPCPLNTGNTRRNHRTQAKTKINMYLFADDMVLTYYKERTVTDFIQGEDPSNTSQHSRAK